VGVVVGVSVAVWVTVGVNVVVGLDVNVGEGVDVSGIRVRVEVLVGANVAVKVWVGGRVAVAVGLVKSAWILSPRSNPVRALIVLMPQNRRDAPMSAMTTQSHLLWKYFLIPGG